MWRREKGVELLYKCSDLCFICICFSFPCVCDVNWCEPLNHTHLKCKRPMRTFDARPTSKQAHPTRVPINPASVQPIQSKVTALCWFVQTGTRTWSECSRRLWHPIHPTDDTHRERLRSWRMADKSSSGTRSESKKRGEATRERSHSRRARRGKGEPTGGWQTGGTADTSLKRQVEGAWDERRRQAGTETAMEKRWVCGRHVPSARCQQWSMERMIPAHGSIKRCACCISEKKWW